MKWTWQQKRSKNIKKDIHVLHQPNAHNFTAGLLSVRLVGYISGGCLLSISCLQHVVWKIISPVKTQTLVSGCVVSASYHGENRGAPPPLISHKHSFSFSFCEYERCQIIKRSSSSLYSDTVPLKRKTGGDISTNNHKYASSSEMLDCIVPMIPIL